MAVTLDITDAYATVAEADAFLTNDATWNAATTADKEDALLDARYFIDTNFSCDLSDYDDIPDELKYANSRLAADYVADQTVFDSQPTTRRREVRADVVEVITEYSSGAAILPPAFATAQGILKEICTGGGASTVFIQRA